MITVGLVHYYIHLWKCVHAIVYSVTPNSRLWLTETKGRSCSGRLSLKMLERISLSIGYKCSSCVLYLCDSRVGTFAVNAVVLQPLVFWVRAVLLESAAVLPFTPNAPKEWVSLQTQTAASALGIALVQVHWERRGASVVFIITV